MSDKTGIEWTDATWNPVTGCTEVSPGCDHCYAKTFAERFRGTPGHYFERGFDVQLRPDKLDQPLCWRRPRRIFVNSMSDLFHDQVPDDHIAKVWGVMAWSPQHTFQVLTKRHGRMRSLLSSSQFRSLVDDAWYHFGREFDMASKVGHPGHPYDRWPLPNVWLGVSTEDQHWADIRIPALLDTPAAVRFISAEPLLGPINLYTDPIEAESPFWGSQLNWVIFGGESGRTARPMHPEWARSLRDQCTDAGIPFLFKQWGEYGPGLHDTGTRTGTVGHGFFSGPVVAGRFTGEYAAMSRVGKKAAGRELDGRTWDQYPAVTA